jgi:hypothetical protein
MMSFFVGAAFIVSILYVGAAAFIIDAVQK